MTKEHMIVEGECSLYKGAIGAGSLLEVSKSEGHFIGIFVNFT